MSQSQIRKAKRRLYKKLKRERRLMKPTKRASILLNTLKPLPPPIARKPNYKTALSRVVDFEVRKPGEFGKWLEDLHIEHFKAGFQERIEKEKSRNEKLAIEAREYKIQERTHGQEERSKDSEEQASAGTEAGRPEQSA
jgi:hypothetical protein